MTLSRKKAPLLALGLSGAFHLALFLILVTTRHSDPLSVATLSSEQESKSRNYPLSFRSQPRAQGISKHSLKDSLKPKRPSDPIPHPQLGPVQEPIPSSGPPSGQTVSTGTFVASPVFLERIRNKIEESLEYPRSLARRRIYGDVKVRLVLTSLGEVELSTITQSSGHDELDRLVLEAIARASPFGTPDPEQKKMGKLTVNLPITFKALK